MPNGLLIDPVGQTVVVSITAAGSGAALTLYSDVNATTTTTNPLTITTPTTVYVRETVNALLSLKVNNVEYATTAGTTRAYTFSDGEVGSVSLAATPLADEDIRFGTSELGYAERTSNDSTTNTTYGSATSNKITGLSRTVVGQGLPVLVEVYVPSVVHSVANTATAVVLLINGSVTGGQQGFGEASSSASITMRRRLILTAGTSYTFEVGKYVTAAGTGTYIGGSDNPMHLAITR